jgi:putative membrane protein insertion efficiency factor
MTVSVYEAIRRAAVWLVLAPVVFYRRVLSPLKRAPTCRFLPTCSEYAIEAVKTRGIVVGGYLATRRICRCHPFGGSGFDPVPAGALSQEGVH